MSIRVHEMYRSIQGESTYAGLPCTFVRTTACDLRCRWCDTEHAFEGGESLSVAEVVSQVQQLGNDLVEITGGEPLLQKELPELCTRLLEEGATVLVETGGHRDISVLPSDVIRIMDIKCPASGMSDKNDYNNIKHLTAKDEVKFVIADRTDFEWAVDIIRQHALQEVACPLLFSPVFGQCEPASLSQWVLETPLKNARMQVQMHKTIWAPDARGV